MDLKQKNVPQDHSSSEESTHFGYQSIPTSSKTARVKQVFQSVAHRYDLMNDLMSLGLHRYWKRLAIARISARPHHRILDLAGGTGDLSAAIAHTLQPSGHIVLADINEAMMAQGRSRLIDKGMVRSVHWVQANAEQLPFPQEHFDRVMMAFGLRNVTHKDKALAEIVRVLKPGGKTIILEFSKPTRAWLQALYDAYSFTVLPFLGNLVCHDRDSYQYLAESIRMHPSQEILKELMLEAGFDKVEYQNVQGGIVALHIGYKF